MLLKVARVQTKGYSQPALLTNPRQVSYSHVIALNWVRICEECRLWQRNFPGPRRIPLLFEE
jgi:hypothetical protein